LHEDVVTVENGEDDLTLERSDRMVSKVSIYSRYGGGREKSEKKWENISSWRKSGAH